MRPLRQIRGLIYPDLYVVRHFFKRGLNQRAGRVLELGCGSGNNLSLYHDMGWSCTGVDFDRQAISDARHNLGGDAALFLADLCEGVPELEEPFDVLILCGILCYLSYEHGRKVLRQARAHLRPGADIFVRTRLLDDVRYGRGDEVEVDGYMLATPDTGEAGLFNRFYSRDDLVALLETTLDITGIQAMHVRFDNYQTGKLVTGNSDIVIWGRAA